MIDGLTVVLVLDALRLKRSQSVKMKRFSHRSICFPPLAYRHKLWEVFVTESTTSLMQAAGMSFLQMLCGSPQRQAGELHHSPTKGAG